jgi:hypothetical protein
MPNLVAYNSGSTIPNSIQFGTIVMDVNGDVPQGSLLWCPDFGICNQYLIITDSYTNEKSNQLNARAMGFQTSGLTDADLIEGINKLARSKFEGPFGTLSDAINWAIYEGYFITNQEYPTIITSGCVLNLDSNFPPSYPLVFDTWYDLTGNGNTGLLNNGITYNSALRGSLLFNGTDQFVSFSATTGIPVGNSNYTISTWFNPSTTSGDRGLVGWGNYGTNNEVNALKISSSEIVNYWWGNDLSATYSFTLGSWYNAVATFDGTTRSIWVNGSLIDSDTPTGHNVPNSTNLEVGVTNGNEFFGGNMGEVQIFNRALSSTEISDNYNALLPRYNGTYTDPCDIAPQCTRTPTMTPTPSVTPPPLVWNLYYPCDSTTPASQVLEWSPSYLGGEIIKGSNGLCYTIAISGRSIASTITVDDEFSTCIDCEATYASPTPTQTETSTQTPTPTYTPTQTETPTPTPTYTQTPSSTPAPLVWNLYYPCDSTTPASQVLEWSPSYLGGEIIKASNGLCYTIAISGRSIASTISVDDEYSTCIDCEQSLISPTPTPTLTQTPTTTTTLTPTPSVTPAPLVWNLYYPCGTTTPASQILEYSSNYLGGEIIKGSNGLCYTIAITGRSIASTISVDSEFSTCEDCEISLISPTPTATPPSTPAATPAATPTPSVTPEPLVWNLYYPCGTTTPASQVLAYTSSYVGGEIIKGSNGLCYTIAITGRSIASTITVDSEYSTCEDCNYVAPTPTPTATLPEIISSGTYVCANGSNCDGEFNITSISGGAGAPYQTQLDSGGWNNYPAVSSYTSLCGGQSYTFSIKDSQGNIKVSSPFVLCINPTPTPTQTPTSTPATYFYNAYVLTCDSPNSGCISTGTEAIIYSGFDELSNGSYYSDGSTTYQPYGSTSNPGPGGYIDVRSYIYTQSGTCFGACQNY